MWWKKYLQPKVELKKVPLKQTSKSGFIEAIPEVADYILGGPNQALKIILSAERDYTNFLPTGETQSRNFDTYACVSFSALNNLEIIYKKQFGTEVNWSDRYLASMSETIAGQGNTFKKVSDAVRKFGVVPEEEYLWSGNSEQEYLKKPTQSTVDKGRAWLQSFEVQYEWVGWGGCNPETLYNALQFGPLQVSVDSSATQTGIVSSNTDHAVTLYKGTRGRSHGIFDQYNGFAYEVPWNFYFGSAMQFSLMKKKTLPLFMVYNKPEIYAVVGVTACHIADETSWKYGEKIGLWKKEIQVYTQKTFDEMFTRGESIIFK